MGLGTGIFDRQELDDTVVVKRTDATKKKWMLFIERVGSDIVAGHT